MKRRQITDGVHVANELVDGWKRRRKPGLVCKIKLEKAYDTVNWGLLHWTMQKKGFGNKWMNWIMGCLDHPHFSVMINGSSKGFFPSSRGLRQGDPLSPLLFTLVADGFSALISMAIEKRIIKGFDSSSSGLSVSHLQFVDDTICFVEVSLDQIVNLKILQKSLRGSRSLKSIFLNPVW